jgi:hypothetical protein
LGKFFSESFIAGRGDGILSEKLNFFEQNSFKIQFSLDNKGVRKICHAELVSASNEIF